MLKTLQALRGLMSVATASNVAITLTTQKAGAEYGDIGWTSGMNRHSASLMLIIFA